MKLSFQSSIFGTGNIQSFCIIIPDISGPYGIREEIQSKDDECKIHIKHRKAQRGIL